MLIIYSKTTATATATTTGQRNVRSTPMILFFTRVLNVLRWTMCDNGRTCLFNNMLVVALTLLAITAPLIQNVVCAADSSISADITSDTHSHQVKPKLAHHTKLTKRNIDNIVVDGTGSKDTTYHSLHGGPKNGEVDFDAYINEYKMQDEAFIPEDILDQQHIQDDDEEDEKHAGLQYATESEATDIVFESERILPNFPKSSSGHVTAYKKDDDKTSKIQTKNYESSFNREKYAKKRDDYYDEIAIVGDELSPEDENNNIKQTMAVSSGSDAYKKFQKIESEDAQQHQHQQQHPQQLEERQQKRHQHQEQLSTIVDLNERKLNKSPDAEQETIKNSRTSKYINRKNENFEDKGSKEGGFEETEQEKDDIGDNNDDDDDDNIATATIGDIGAGNEDEALQIDTKDAHNNDELSNNGKDKSVVATTQRSISHSEFESQRLTSTIIGRKNKRFNRVRSFNSGNGRQQNNDDIHHKSRPKLLLIDDDDDNDDDDDDDVEESANKPNSQKPEITEEAKFHNNYAIKSYAIDTAMRNGSNGFKDIQNTSSGQMAHRKSSGKENFNNGEIEAQQKASFVIQNEQWKGQQLQQQQKEQQQQQQQYDQPKEEQSQHETPKSAFEQHKARRRNNGRYGHKSHKKRYKDYLRFAMTPMTTTIAPSPSPSPLTSASASPMLSTFATRNASQWSVRPKTEAEKEKEKEELNRHFATVANETNAAIQATLAKLTSNLKRNYENNHETERNEHFDQYGRTEQRRVDKLKKYAKKIAAEQERELPASPIFVVANRNSVTTRVSPSNKPFYEGQISYFMETRDDEQTGSGSGSNNKLQTDTANWYRRVSPVLRNGVKTSLIDGNDSPNEHRRINHNLHHHNHHHHRHQQQHQYHHSNNPHDHHSHLQHNERNHHQILYNHQNTHQHQHRYHHGQQHQHQHQHNQQQHQQFPHQKHEQTNKHYQSAKSNPYQRKIVKKLTPTLGNGIASPLYSHSTPIPPPSYKSHAGAMQELGHQITEMEELERYYAKWPHLARVQLQVYDEHFRELHPEIYPDYDQDYESAAELEEAQNGNSEDANLPPYIKKYNRRNKQLLNLLEGTLAPPTNVDYFKQGQFSSLLQPGPHESSSGGGGGGGGGGGNTVVRIDDEYMKEKRRRYHNRYGNKNNNNNKGFQYDLFAEQRAALNANANDSAELKQNSTENHVVTTKFTATTNTPTIQLQNKIPEEEVSIAREEHNGPAEIDWKEEIETKSNGNSAEMTGNVEMSWQIEKLTTPSTLASSKSAIYRLPSYPAISGSYIGQSRSQNAQFAPSTITTSSSSSGGSRNSINSNSGGNTFINMHRDYHNLEKTRHIATAMSTLAPESQATASSSSADTDMSSSSGKAINSFVYHRVVDSAPRFVGAGTTGLKQRLPFVAITDRRLETVKKTLMEHKQDLEQNFYPMP